MYKLKIDTSDRVNKSILLLRDGMVIDEVYGDIDIVGEIQTLLQKNNINSKEIDEVVPNLGPGSFTGLKIGVTIANILNWANGNKTIGELDLPDYGREPNIEPPQQY